MSKQNPQISGRQHDEGLWMRAFHPQQVWQQCLESRVYADEWCRLIYKILVAERSQIPNWMQFLLEYHNLPPLRPLQGPQPVQGVICSSASSSNQFNLISYRGMKHITHLLVHSNALTTMLTSALSTGSTPISASTAASAPTIVELSEHYQRLPKSAKNCIVLCLGRCWGCLSVSCAKLRCRDCHIYFCLSPQISIQSCRFCGGCLCAGHLGTIFCRGCDRMKICCIPCSLTHLSPPLCLPCAEETQISNARANLKMLTGKRKADMISSSHNPYPKSSFLSNLGPSSYISETIPHTNRFTRSSPSTIFGPTPRPQKFLRVSERLIDVEILALHFGELPKVLRSIVMRCIGRCWGCMSYACVRKHCRDCWRLLCSCEEGWKACKFCAAKVCGDHSGLKCAYSCACLYFCCSDCERILVNRKPLCVFCGAPRKNFLTNI